MPTLSPTRAAELLHAYGLDGARERGVDDCRILAWRGRAEGSNQYFYRFIAKDLKCAFRVKATADELYTMQWLLSKGCLFELGTTAALFFPQRPGYFLHTLRVRAEGMPRLPANARLAMPRPHPRPGLGYMTVPEGGVREGPVTLHLPQEVMKFIDAEDLPAPPEVSPPTALADPEDGVPEEKVKRVKVS